MKRSYLQDAKKIDCLSECAFAEESLDDVLVMAKFVVDQYNGDGNFFNDELKDEDSNVRMQAKRELKQLEKFIKKYDDGSLIS